ncbi:MAG: diadenylate cyclase CdaA [Mycoplasmatales bacterium]
MNIYISVLTNILDIVIATLIIYQVLKFIIKSEKMIFIINAIVLILIIYLLSLSLELNVVNSLLSNVFSWGIVLIFILFQGEIRTSLEKLGSRNSRQSYNISNSDFVDYFVEAIETLASQKIGALITFEMEMVLTEYTEKAIAIDAKYSSHLLLTIFNKESPLHDGAVIMKDGRLAYASTYFPIGLDFNIDKKYGTRHRSALTISSLTDSITIVVSEETGEISIAYKGNLYTDLEHDFIIEYLNNKLKK